MREYRIQELLDRRESLVSQIEELRTARDILTSQNNGNSSASAASEAARRTSGASPTLATSDPLFEPPTRPIDEWAINRWETKQKLRLTQWEFEYRTSLVLVVSIELFCSQIVRFCTMDYISSN